MSTENKNRNVFPIENQPSNAWAEPIPLDIARPAELPIELWPDVLRNYAKEAAEDTETPQGLPALLALGTMALAAQGLADVQIKQNYKEPLNLYAAVVVESGARKSSEFNRATTVLGDWQEMKNKEIQPEVDREAAIREIREARVTELRKRAAKAESNEKADEFEKQIIEAQSRVPEVPSFVKLVSSDITTEHAATVMAQNNERLGIMSSEGGIFDTMAGRYTHGIPNIDLYLQAHSGDRVTVDRASKDAIDLRQPRLTMILAIQPDVLHSLHAKPGLRGRGLLARFLYLIPPSNLGKRTGATTPMSTSTQRRFEERVIELVEEAYQNDTLHTIKLSSDARRTWEDFWRSVERKLLPNGELFDCCDWGAKLPGTVARLAAIFHVARHGTKAVDLQLSAEDMEAAAETGFALSSHAQSAFGAMRTASETEHAKKLLSWIRRNGFHEFSCRDAHQAHKSRFQNAVDIYPVLRLLNDHGYIRRIAPPKGKSGRPVHRYEVNPRALE